MSRCVLYHYRGAASNKWTPSRRWIDTPREGYLLFSRPWLPRIIDTPLSCRLMSWEMRT